MTTSDAPCGLSVDAWNNGPDPRPTDCDLWLAAEQALREPVTVLDELLAIARGLNARDVRMLDELIMEIESWRPGYEFKHVDGKIALTSFGKRALARAMKRDEGVGATGWVPCHRCTDPIDCCSLATCMRGDQ